jgi:hypothetical protein
MMNINFIGMISVSSIIMGLTGCGLNVLKEGEPNFNTNLLLPVLSDTPAPNAPGYAPSDKKIVENRANNSSFLTPQYMPNDCEKPDEKSVENKPGPCVLAFMAYIDESFREYKINLHHFVSYGNAGADMLQEGLSIASSVAPSQAASKVYSAIASGVGASKTQIDEDLVFKKTIEIVLNQMDADRKQKASYILTQLKKASYTMDQARLDLLEYFADGTWDHAMNALEAQVSVNNANATAALCSAKQGGSNTTASQQGDAAASADASTQSPSTAGGAAPSQSSKTPSAADACPVTTPGSSSEVGITATLPDSISSRPKTPIKVVVSKLTDDVVTLEFLVSGKAQDIDSVDGKPPSALTSQDIKVAGSYSFVLKTLPKAGSEIDVQVTGKKGAATTGPQIYKKINVITATRNPT